ncbi:unnamed protein product, partial [Soboliphyme baturini]|uniref:Transposase n=1 Tax=Soboliphyme baturini TaxID=241478 RepID=A0A183IRF0_9BILA
MGYPVSVVSADVYMDYLEVKALKEYRTLGNISYK